MQIEIDSRVTKVERAARRRHAHCGAASRPDRSRSSADRKAKYRQIKVDIGFQRKVQKTYIAKTVGSVPSTLTAAFPLTVGKTSKSFSENKSDVLTVVSGGTAPLQLAPDHDLALTPSRFGPSARETATQVQLTVANRNYLHQLASSCTKLRNLHQKIFCQKNKTGRGLLPLPPLSSLTPFLRFSSSKVGRLPSRKGFAPRAKALRARRVLRSEPTVPPSESRSIGAGPIPSEPNLNTEPSPKVGRHSLGSPLPSDPNLNDLPLLRFTRAARENARGSLPITALQSLLLKSVIRDSLRFFRLTETNAIQRYLTPTSA
jgi:hypothetical protein